MDPVQTEGQSTATATPTDTPAAAPAPAPAPEPSLEEAALAAMDEGLAKDQPAAAEPAAKGSEEPAAEPVPGTSEAAAADAAKPKPEAGKEGEPAKPERDEATETEITTLGLKEKAAERFRALAGEVKELAPIKEALTKAGIKDVADLPQLAQHAQFGRELYQQVQETGATAEQYGQALDYLRVIGLANRGDAKAAEQAYAVLTEELSNLAKMLGKDIPGIVDPLADHPDLLKQVQDSDITRAAALETARLRNTQALREAQRQADANRQTSDAAQQQALTQATADLNALGAELAGSDPHYAAKAPILVAQLQEIRADLPPAKWAAAARRLYATIPNPAPAAAPPAKPTPGPVRGSAVRPVVVPVTDDPLEALEQGIAAANR